MGAIKKEMSSVANTRLNNFCVSGDKVFVELPNADEKMIVDYEDWELWAKNYRWRIDKSGYAVTYKRFGKSTRRMWYHIMVLPDCPRDMLRDHIDGNVLNNCKENLRIVTHIQSGQNRGVPRNNKSGHTGVYWHKATQKWDAQIKVNKQLFHLGLFDNIQDAVSA